MSNLLTAIGLQIFWFIVVKFGQHEHSYLLWPLALALNVSYFKLFVHGEMKVSFKILSFSLILWGAAQEGILFWSNSTSLTSFPWWIHSLWVVFALYYPSLFRSLKRLPYWSLSILGAGAAMSTYWLGFRMAGVEIEKPIVFLVTIGMSWGVMFPMSFKLFYTPKLWDKILDSSIIFSFDQTGFLRHQKDFNEQLDGTGKNIFVTGGSSGIGRSTVQGLVTAKANVWSCGRSKKPDQLPGQYLRLDLSRYEQIDSVVDQLPILDCLVLNAGAMPKEKVLGEHGHESQFASQLMGHYLLAKKLQAAGKLKNKARIIWVSSGGMYLKKLDVHNLLNPLSYDKVDVYANVKRAQVTLVEELAVTQAWSEHDVMGMHPGWVATSGLLDALPGFSKFIGKRLRTAAAGADTIIWQCLTKGQLKSGGFYFDRRLVSPYLTKSYDPSAEERKQLLDLLEHTAGLVT